MTFRFLLVATLATASAFAATITGTVTNKTTSKPAAYDDVVLIKLAQGMQESTRTKTDIKGRFTLDVPDDGIHLVRVTHQKANYFRPAPPGTQSVDIDVYTSAEHVTGITGEAEVMRIQSDPGGSGLRVVENFFVKNDSTPPMTQISDRPFEFYLPAGAVIEGSAALSPGGMPVQAAPVPLGDTPNHFAFVFPIRPGETRFQITYKLTYSGSLKFSPRLVMPTDTVAIMLPKSMKFAAGQSTAYAPVTEDTTAQTYVARSVVPSQPMDFTISGEGQLPRDPAPNAGSGTGDPAGGNGSAAAGGGASTAGQAASDTRPGGGLGTPIDPEGTNDPWAKYKWWILGGLGLALAAGAGFLLKTPGTKHLATSPLPENGSLPPQSSSSLPPSASPLPQAVEQLPQHAIDSTAPFKGQGPSAVLAALKEELFALETDRLQGRLTEAQYIGYKSALEIVLGRALDRIENAPAHTPARAAASAGLGIG